MTQSLQALDYININRDPMTQRIGLIASKASRTSDVPNDESGFAFRVPKGLSLKLMVVKQGECWWCS